MQHQILINVIIFVAYVLNLPLNTQMSHSRSQRAGKWSLIFAHDRRPIYRAPTYIAVPLLGPHQPRYIGLTLNIMVADALAPCITRASAAMILIIQNRQVLVLPKEEFQLPVSYQCGGVT